MRCFARRGIPAFRVAASCRYNATVAASTGVPAAAVNLANPYYLTWGHLNGAERSRWERLWEKNDHKVDFNAIRHDLAAGKVKPAAFSGKLSDAVAKAKTVADLANTVEAAFVPVRVLEKEREALQLQIWGLSDLIYLGLSASKPAQIEAYKVDLAKSKADLAANRKKAADYIAATFDTDSFNAVINIFRIAGEDDARALEYAGRLLDDMSQLLNLPFNTATQLLLKSVVFGDAPHEDSNVLFTFVENPERGEVSAAKDGDLTKISDDAMKTLSLRHTTPLTDGKLLRQTDTHPMLQRSPE